MPRRGIYVHFFEVHFFLINKKSSDVIFCHDIIYQSSTNDLIYVILWKKNLREIVLNVQMKGIVPKRNKGKETRSSAISSMSPVVSSWCFTPVSTLVVDTILAFYPQLRNTFDGYFFVYFFLIDPNYQRAVTKIQEMENNVMEKACDWKTEI